MPAVRRRSGAALWVGGSRALDIRVVEGTGPTVRYAELSDREREVLELVAGGMTNTDIARRLVVSPNTVRNHVSNIFTKLRVTDRAEAISRARRAALGG